MEKRKIIDAIAEKESVPGEQAESLYNLAMMTYYSKNEDDEGQRYQAHGRYGYKRKAAAADNPAIAHDKTGDPAGKPKRTKER